jgi:hypothetical protein
MVAKVGTMVKALYFRFHETHTLQCTAQQCTATLASPVLRYMYSLETEIVSKTHTHTHNHTQSLGVKVFRCAHTQSLGVKSLGVLKTECVKVKLSLYMCAQD